MRNAFFVRSSGSRSGRSRALKVDRINNIRVMATSTRILDFKNMPPCEVQALSFGKKGKRHTGEEKDLFKINILCACVYIRYY